MSNNTFSALEMLKIAILMEEEGYNFYINGANYTTGKTKEFLLAAGGQEFIHKEKFTKLFNELSANKETESEYLSDIEVTQYLRELIENQVFNNKVQSKDTFSNLKVPLTYSLIENEIFNRKEQSKDAFTDLKAALRYAVKTEELTVKVYTQMYKGISQADVIKILDTIINEEKAHVEYFSKLLKEIVA